MNAPILVTGGTGTLGRLVTQRLRAAGRSVRVLSRSSHAPEDGIEFVIGDVSTGDGLEAALNGVAIVVHCAGSSKDDEIKTRNLVHAAAGTEVRHIVYISVVGAERMPVVSAVDRAMFGYYASKLGAETVIVESGIPFSILRATQFQESMLAVAKGMAKMPVMPSPTGTRFQPVAATEVADRLVELALGAPAGLVPEMGGPRVYLMSDLIRGYLRVTHRRRLFLPIHTPGNGSRAIRQGANLTPEHAVGRRSWEEFLDQEVQVSPV